MGDRGASQATGAEDRRSVRQGLHGLIDTVQQLEPELVQAQADGDRLSQVIEEGGRLLSLIEHPRELHLDSELQRNITRVMSKKVSNIKIGSGDAQPSDLVRAIRERFSVPGEDDGRVRIDWLRLGKEFGHLLRTVPRLSLVAGAFQHVEPKDGEVEETQQKQRKPKKDKSRSQEEEEVQPERNVRGQHQAECTEQMNRAMLHYTHRQLATGPLRFVDLCLDKQSFTRSAENLFSAAFLVKEGLVGIDGDDPQLRVFVPAAGESQASQAGNRHSQQCIIKFNKEEWLRLREMGGHDVPIPPAGDGALSLAAAAAVAASQVSQVSQVSQASQPEVHAAKRQRTLRPPPKSARLVKREHSESEPSSASEEEIIADRRRKR